MNNSLIELIGQNLMTIYGKIKVKDIIFINNIQILGDNQSIILNIIKNSTNRKLIEQILNRTDSYHSNIIWLFDNKTQIKKITPEEKQTNRFIFITAITIMLAAIISFVLYQKNNYIGIAIVFISVIAMIGSFIVYRKLHMFNNMTQKEKDIQETQTNKKDIEDMFSFIHEIYSLDIYMENKKYIRDTLKILRNIITKPDGLNKLNSDKNKYSKMVTKVLEYLGMIDIYISITKLVLYDSYVLPEYIDNKYPYLEIVGDHHIKFDENINVLYAIGNYEKRNSFIEDIIKNIYSAQSVGICNYGKMRYTPFTAIMDREIGEISDIIETLNNAEDNSKYLVIITMSREMNHYFIEQLQKLVKYKNIILILSFADIIKDLDIDKYILKEF